MTEKATMIEQLKFYVDTYKKEKVYNDGELIFCGSFHSGVQVFGVKNIFKIAKFLGVTPETRRRVGDKDLEVSVMYEGVRFFAIGAEKEMEVNV